MIEFLWGLAEGSGTPPYVMVCKTVRFLLLQYVYQEYGQKITYLPEPSILVSDTCRPTKDPSYLVISSEIHSPLSAS